ncbi:MAG: YraN family protein [Oscillospiraceae bacterium]|nr:YraN family protein [Oscillospiraceae bacterium]MBQ9981575.1 YraN family protein [Oscillospiraceae bacterium]MBR6647544.1 YraN family protein [Clostridia bacterium]
MTKRDLGNKGEDAVCRYIEKYGYRIIERNFVCKKGEIDIIAENDDTIAFIEVKSRKEDSMVSGAEAVNYTKKMRIIKTAAYYTYKNPLTKQPRFDIAEVILKNNIPSLIRYYKSAFDMTDCNIMLSLK